MLSGELDASETMARLPVTAPAAVGANFTVNAMLWLTASVAGSVNPLMEKPAPVTLACEIVTDDPPVLVSVSDLLLLPPTCTLPNATLAGLALRVPTSTPTPFKARTTTSTCTA